jgi:hypothetical protein
LVYIFGTYFFVCTTATRKKAEKLKNGQLMNLIQHPLIEKPSFDGANCNNEFEKEVNESKNIQHSSTVVNGSTNNDSSAFSTNDLSVEETSFMQLQDVMNQVGRSFLAGKLVPYRCTV